MESFKEMRERAPRPQQTLGPFDLHSPPARPLAALEGGHLGTPPQPTSSV